MNGLREVGPGFRETIGGPVAGATAGPRPGVTRIVRERATQVLDGFVVVAEEAMHLTALRERPGVVRLKLDGPVEVGDRFLAAVEHRLGLATARQHPRDVGLARERGVEVSERGFELALEAARLAPRRQDGRPRGVGFVGAGEIGDGVVVPPLVQVDFPAAEQRPGIRFVERDRRAQVDQGERAILEASVGVPAGGEGESVLRIGRHGLVEHMHRFPVATEAAKDFPLLALGLREAWVDLDQVIQRRERGFIASLLHERLGVAQQFLGRIVHGAGVVRGLVGDQGAGR